MAGISVVFFAHLRETIGQSELRVKLTDLITPDTDGLLTYLKSELDGFSTYADGQAVLIAVNQSLINRNTPISDGDVVALFPPVTGG